MYNHSDKPAWSHCVYCDGTDFTTIHKFTSEQHCTKEGGSFVCRYGENNVCCTLPVEGVSDADYERHVYKHHTTTTPFNNSRKMSTSSTGADKQNSNDAWSLSSAVQNLSAVLNDPTKGKRKDFFTKTWGDSFVEVTNVPDPNYLPHISRHHFEHYLKKIAKRHKKYHKLNVMAPKPHSHADLLQTFPTLRLAKYTEKNNFDISVIPKIYLQPSFDLSNLETFNAVYTHTVSANAPSPSSVATSTASTSAKLLQEKLTHYLDMVEVQIAQQVSLKSDAFFHAMTSHDVLMDQLGYTINVVRNLREKIQKVDQDVVKESIRILKNERFLVNSQQVYRKLKVMSTVMQTQPTIQLLLSSPDYVGALDLIHTTEDLLKQELAGVHSFRHLSSELTGIVSIIDNLMANEFERYCASDLNRPLTDDEPEVLEGEKLSCVVMGMLRRGTFDFIEKYQKEVTEAVKAAVNMAAIEIVSGTDVSGDRLDEQLKSLPVDEWAQLLSNTCNVLLRLCKRVKKTYEVLVNAVDISAGRDKSKENDAISLTDSGEFVLSPADHTKVRNRLQKLLEDVCQYSQKRCAQLLSNRSLMWPDEKYKEDNKANNWLAERATFSQLKELGAVVNRTTDEWNSICPGTKINDLSSAFYIQATKFMVKFHLERTTKLCLILDGEPWKKIEVPDSFQKLVDLIDEKGTFSTCKGVNETLSKSDNKKVEPFLYLGAEKFAVVGTVLMLVQIVAEYCGHAEEIPQCSEPLLRHLRELLSKFNSKCVALILKGEAVSEKTGLKQITSTNLALLLRALQLLLWLIPHVRLHFQGLNVRVENLTEVTQNIRDHAAGIRKKLEEIMRNLILLELKKWEAKPPVPSKSFQNICKHLKKLHEAVVDVLPTSQIQDLYKSVHSNFKDDFRETLQKMKIVGDGGVTHGLVSTELLFYLEDLRKVNALPLDQLELSSMDDIWVVKAPL